MLSDNIKLFDKIVFEEGFKNEFTKEVELYYVLPREYLLQLNPEEYENAHSVSLCLVYIEGHRDVDNIYGRYAPTIVNEYGSLEDCDWNYIDLSTNDKICLLDLALNEPRQKGVSA